MSTVRCKACQKVYNYERNGCCPACGAYNRPPRREEVEADGTVRHLDGRGSDTGRVPPHRGKICFEKKECHEEKTCYEGQARRRTAANPLREVEKGWEQLRARRRRGRPVLLLVVAAALIVLVAVRSCAGLLNHQTAGWPGAPSYDIQVEDDFWPWDAEETARMVQGD